LECGDDGLALAPRLHGWPGGDGRLARRRWSRRAAAATTLTWMGWQGYETPILSGSFIADNDIDFQPTFISSNEEIITKLQAGGIGKTDLITMYFGYLPLMAEGGLLSRSTLRASRFCRSGGTVHRQEAIKYNGQLVGIPWTWGSLPIMYDPTVVTSPPTSWFDVMKPEYKGKVAMVDDPLGQLLVWGRPVTGAEVGTLLSKEQLAKVIDFLIEVKTKQARAFFATYSDMADAFARNEIVISTIGWEAVAVWAKQKGKTIDYTIPQEGTGMFMDCLCIPKDCPHVDLTYGLMNHILSPDPQTHRDRAERWHHQSEGRAEAAGGTADELPLQRYRWLHAARSPVPGAAHRGRPIRNVEDFLEEYERLKRPSRGKVAARSQGLVLRQPRVGP
jgi:spermidine/putrescine transport system substrate-binding protein